MRPDILIIDKKAKNCQILDVAIPDDGRMRAKEDEKVEKNQDLAREIRMMWGVREKVIPIVVGALGTNTTEVRRKSEDHRCRHIH